MARINIEDEFWVDVTEVAIKTGSQDLAIGNALRFFRFAQEKYRQGELISESEFKSKGFLEALFPTIAERVDGGIRAIGDEKFFGWLTARSNAGKKGGMASGRTRSNKNNNLGLEAKRSKTKQTQANEPSVSGSISDSVSFSSSSSDSTSDSKRKKKKESPEKQILNSEVWDAYRQAYLDRYKIEPIKNLTANLQASHLASRLGRDAIEVVKFYLKHNDSFYLKKTHSIGLCLHDAETLRTQWMRGKPITNTIVRQFEKAEARHNLYEKIDRGEI